MEKLVPILFCFGFGWNAKAQSVEISLSNTSVDISGTVYQVAISDNEPFDINFDIKNSAIDSQSYTLTRILLSNPMDWTYGFNWNHPSDFSQMNSFPFSPDSIYQGAEGVVLAPNEIGKFVFHIIPPNEPNTSVLYRFYVVDEMQIRVDSLDILLNGTLEVFETDLNQTSLEISPNPANNTIRIHTTRHEDFTLNIMDVFGKIILHQKSNNYESIDVSAYENGIYFILISGEGMNTINRKLVVRH